MTNTNNGLYGFLGGSKRTVSTIETALVTFAQADETGRALIVATGVAAETVEAKYTGPSAEADDWNF